MHNDVVLDYITISISVKEFFQRVTDLWSLRFVRQRENCESQ